jgi:hypothetical protein
MLRLGLLETFIKLPIRPSLSQMNPSRLKILLLSGLGLQCLSWFREGLLYGTSFSRFLLLNGVPDVYASLFEKVLLSLTTLTFIVALFKKDVKGPLWIYPAVLILDSLLIIEDSQTPGVGLILLSRAATIGFPLALFFWKNNQKNLCFHLLKYSIGLTFIGHGCKVLLQYPEYQDYLYTLFETMRVPLSDSHMESLMLVIGVTDLFTGIFILFKPSYKPALLYLLFWGFLTALLRPFYNGLEGIYPFLIRIPHWLIPLLLILWTKRIKRGVTL